MNTETKYTIIVLLLLTMLVGGTAAYIYAQPNNADVCTRTWDFETDGAPWGGTVQNGRLIISGGNVTSRPKAESLMDNWLADAAYIEFDYEFLSGGGDITTFLFFGANGDNTLHQCDIQNTSGEGRFYCSTVEMVPWKTTEGKMMQKMYLRMFTESFNDATLAIDNLTIGGYCGTTARPVSELYIPVVYS